MGTIVAMETEGGAAIAGDTRAIRGETVVGPTTRVFEFDRVGAGAVGEEGDVAAFRRRLEAELDVFALEHERELTVEVLGHIAARVAEETGVEAVVATHDREGRARIRQVGSDGSVLSDPVAALGTGTQAAFGRLESTDRDLDRHATERLVRDVVETVGERDPQTGGSVDSWSLASDSGEE